jgi:ATP-dependent DNA helicase RecG
LPEHKVDHISRIITDAVDAGRIRIDDPESRSRRYAKYVPYWG